MAKLRSNAWLHNIATRSLQEAFGLMARLITDPYYKGSQQEHADLAAINARYNKERADAELEYQTHRTAIKIAAKAIGNFIADHRRAHAERAAGNHEDANRLEMVATGITTEENGSSWVRPPRRFAHLGFMAYVAARERDQHEPGTPEYEQRDQERLAYAREASALQPRLLENAAQIATR